jgi:hypothetical protein
MTNEYRKSPLISTSAGRQVWSFNAYLEECYTVCGERSTQVYDAAMNEWNNGKKDVPTVKKAICRPKSNH